MYGIFPPFLGGRGAVGLLILRVITGAAFILHSWPKIQSPFAWMPPEAPVPGFLQMLAAVAEFGGGIALVLGLLTPLAALGLACTMAVAVGMVHLPQGHPFVSLTGKPSFELAAAYLGNVLMLLLVGPGTLSLDALLFNRPRPGEPTPR